MVLTIIGIDRTNARTPRSLDADEAVAAQLRIPADRRQTDRLLVWAAQWPERRWAVENCNGLGRLLAQQLVRHGETVVDVPTTLSARTRRLSGHSGRKTDEHDARPVAIAAAGDRRLRRVQPEDFSVVLGLLVDRRWHLVSHQQKTICRLHALLAELQPGGAKLGLSVAQAAKLLRSLRPQTVVDVERKQIAQELLADWRRLHKRIPDVARRIRDALAAHGRTLTQLYGIGDVGAATIVAIVGDVRRFPTRGHFAAFNGTAPLDASSGDVIRHRHNRGGNHQLNVIHLAAVTQIRNGAQDRDHYRRKIAEGKGRGEAMRSLKRQLSDVIYRRLIVDARRREAVREDNRERGVMSA